MKWISVNDRLPDKGAEVLAFYKNSNGKKRRIRAVYIRKFEEEEDYESEMDCDYNEELDCYYLPEGWYECIDNWSEYTSIYVHEGEVTHWMPLPAPPEGEE
jgi:hypothetical protein